MVSGGSKMTIRLLGFLLVVVAVVATACGPAYSPAPAPAATPSPAPTPATGLKEVTVAARYPAFTPSTISAAPGEAFQLKLSSADLPHTFTIAELGLNISVGAGQTVTREVTVDKAGTYTFYCSVPGHRPAGMEGTLVVGAGGAAPPTATPPPQAPQGSPTPYRIYD